MDRHWPQRIPLGRPGGPHRHLRIRLHLGCICLLLHRNHPLLRRRQCWQERVQPQRQEVVLRPQEEHPQQGVIHRQREPEARQGRVRCPVLPYSRRKLLTRVTGTSKQLMSNTA
jgi:hypothetical protein